MTSGKIKLLSTALGLAVLIATPAIAGAAHKARAKSPDAYASQTQQAHEMVGWEGQPLGTDPDPNIRFQLRDQSRRRLIPTDAGCVDEGAAN
jgi:hypothetical protein